MTVDKAVYPVPGRIASFIKNKKSINIVLTMKVMVQIIIIVISTIHHRIVNGSIIY